MGAAFDAGSIFVNLRTKTKEFIEGFRRARNVANRFFAAMRRGAATVAKTGRAMTKFGRTMTTKVTLPLTIAFGLILRSIDKQAKAVAQLSAVIGSTGAAAGVTAVHIEDLAASIQKTTRVGDELVIRGAAILLTFTNIRNAGDGMNAIFDRTTRLAVDMGAALDQDLKQSMIQLGKAINDPLIGLSALQRVGVSFTKKQKEQVKILIEANDLLAAQALILDELEKQFSGVAASLARKGIGPLVQGANDLSDAFESFGEVLAPAIAKLGMWVSDAAAFVTSLPDSKKRLLLIIAAIVAALGPLLLALGAITTLLGSVVIPGLATFGTAMLAVLGPIGFVAVAIGAVTLALTSMIGRFVSGRKEMNRYGEQAQRLNKTLDGQQALIGKDLTRAVIKFGDAMRKFRVANEVAFGTAEWRKLGEAAETASLAIGDAAKVSQGLILAAGLTAGDIGRFQDAARRGIEEAKAAGPATLEFKIIPTPAELERLRQLWRNFGEDVQENVMVAVDQGSLAIDRMTAAIDLFGDRGREDLKKVIEEAGRLETELRETFKAIRTAGPESYDVLLASAEDLIAKLDELRAKLVIPPVESVEFTEAQNALQASAEAAGNTIGNAIVSGIQRGATALEILAELGERLFVNHLGKAIQTVSKLGAIEIAKIAKASSAQVEAVMNIAIAAVGFILAQLDRGTEVIDSFRSQAAEVMSSQLVRGIVAGPQNVAIAEVNESISSAFVGTEDRLDMLIGIGQELILVFSGGGASSGIPGSAGRAGP